MKDEPGMLSPYLKPNPREVFLMKGVGVWPYERRCPVAVHGDVLLTTTVKRKSYVCHTCRDDANPEGAGHQHGSGVIGVNASTLLRPPNHPMQHLAEHAIPADTHDAAGGTQVCQAH